MRRDIYSTNKQGDVALYYYKPSFGGFFYNSETVVLGFLLNRDTMQFTVYQQNVYTFPFTSD